MQKSSYILNDVCYLCDRLCGRVVDSRHYQIFWVLVRLEQGPLRASWVQLRSYLEEIVAAPV
jgi:hypothetical protein